MPLNAFDNDGKFQHYCKYVVMRKTIVDIPSGKHWIERCKCNRLLVIDCKFVVEGSNSPQITKTWFDKDGNIEKVTGYKTNN